MKGYVKQLIGIAIDNDDGSIDIDIWFGRNFPLCIVDDWFDTYVFSKKGISTGIPVRGTKNSSFKWRYHLDKIVFMPSMPHLIHCSYHKCLTKLYSNIMRAIYNRTAEDSPELHKIGGFRHFSSQINEFYRDYPNYRIVSVNNHYLDLDRLGDFRISRFIRDPRDLVVSGYFYHKRGAEAWCRIVGPDERNWTIVNGHIPIQMGNEYSLSTYLQGLTQEDGLIAEIEVRKYHFNSMLQWPDEDPRIRLFRYEDILGNEQEVISELFSFYGLSTQEQELGENQAREFSVQGPSALKQHIRNPKPNQWKEQFTPKVSRYFEDRYGKLLEKYGYG